MAPHIANFLLGSFGIVAAVLLVGGSVLLRAQQNRQRFELAKKALDAGHALPALKPLWIGLRRQAQSILTVGVGLILVGAAAWWLGADVAMPEAGQAATAPAEPAFFGARLTPPRPDPQMEVWHSAQERIAVGQTAVGCGVVLTLLGTVRLKAAKAEQNFGR